jgi:hypothetical protein
MKQMIRSGMKSSENGRISQMRWNKLLNMMEMTVKTDEEAKWDETND